jgi:hypothetical protein
MMRPVLIQRREVWLPTIWGWLALLLLGCSAAVLGGRSLHPFLALNEPIGARVLVVEGWIDPSSLDQAVAAFQSGGYEMVVTTGGPVDWPEVYGSATFAALAATYLRQHGLAAGSVIAVSAPATSHDRTFLSALMVREWMRRSGIKYDKLDVFSQGAHARRSRLLYRLAFGSDFGIGILAARSADYDAGQWWRTSTGAREVLEQAIGLLWVKCFFWPAGSD